MSESFRKMRKETIKQPDDIWIISRGRYADMDLSRVSPDGETQWAVAYEISDLARYLLSPASIEVTKSLVGCEVHYRRPVFSDFKTRLMNRLTRRMRPVEAEGPCFKDVLISPHRPPLPELEDQPLKAHFSRIDALLSPDNPVARKLAALKMNRIADRRYPPGRGGRDGKDPIRDGSFSRHGRRMYPLAEQARCGTASH